MSNLLLNVKKQFDFDEIRLLYQNPDDLSLAFPSASFPVDESQWNKWMANADSENYSLTFYLDDIPISHLSLKSYKESPGLCYLCFFIVDSEYRAKGYAKEAMSLTYDFIRSVLKKNEVWLIVDPNNTSAYSLYRKEGFKIVDKKLAGLRLKKKI
ncbi:GNAT family N-acetyltransferase [Halobacteriovorax sp. HLS]|uniref:GNAT family N-acetyltransferase n=1 Tax=Halobacteriovorax sp. HLS TaxID=2234000 RepID=UPI000FD86568|nr:GNAT family N-acetyltransferase [Halobacteriovorax sp. HLS]